MLHFKQKVTAKNELAIFLGGGPENEFQMPEISALESTSNPLRQKKKKKKNDCL